MALLKTGAAAAALWFLYEGIRMYRRWDGAVIEKEVYLVIAGTMLLCMGALLSDRLLVLAYVILLWMAGIALLEYACRLFLPGVSGEERFALVLGAPVFRGRPTPNLISRAEAAAVLCARCPEMAVILSGGRGEAEQMAEVLLQRGVSADRILEERRSTTTEENFAFSEALLRTSGWDGEEPVVIVTNDFHIFRLRYYAHASGFCNLHFRAAPTPREERFIWFLREIILIHRYWILKK